MALKRQSVRAVGMLFLVSAASRKMLTRKLVPCQLVDSPFPIVPTTPSHHEYFNRKVWKGRFFLL